MDIPELLRSPLNPAGVCIDATTEKVPDNVLKNDVSYALLPLSATMAEAMIVDDESTMFKDSESDPDVREFEKMSLL